MSDLKNTERRFRPRFDTHVLGSIFHDGRMVFCEVCNSNADGAFLVFARDPVLPEEFELTLVRGGFPKRARRLEPAGASQFRVVYLSAEVVPFRPVFDGR